MSVLGHNAGQFSARLGTTGLVSGSPLHCCALVVWNILSEYQWQNADAGMWLWDMLLIWEDARPLGRWYAVSGTDSVLVTTLL